MSVLLYCLLFDMLCIIAFNSLVCVCVYAVCQGREKLCRTPSGSERKRKRLGVADGDNGTCRLMMQRARQCLLSAQCH